MQKKMMVRIAFVLQLILYGAWYVWGEHGLKALTFMVEQNELVTRENQMLEKELARLDERLILLQEDPFFKETIARTQLQMARSDETVYYID